VDGPLCIAGMHRSGTSLVASWLQRSGLALDDGQSLGPDEGNPHGHFEDEEFVALHATAIAIHDHRARGWVVTGSRAPTATDEFIATARDLVARRSARNVAWGWKDPRSTLFLETWKQLVPELKTLLLWRPCLDVVASLLSRAARSTEEVFHIGAVEAVRAWIHHNRLVLDYARAHANETLVCSVPRLLAHGDAVAGILRDRWSLALEGVTFGSVVDPSLYRSRNAPLLVRAAAAALGARALERELERVSFDG